MRCHNLAGLAEMTDLELEFVSGSGNLPFDPNRVAPGTGGEVHGTFSGPPLKGEFGASYTGPRGGMLGGTVACDGRDWMAGITGGMRSRSGNFNASGSAYSNGHDWGVQGTFILRF
jgi:hypothetical protein